jgi:RND family efflux transporter MFP subunit
MSQIQIGAGLGAMAGQFLRYAVAGALVLLASCSKAPSPLIKAQPVTVTLATVGASNGSADLVVSGTVRLKRETPLSFNTNGRIATIAVTEGQIVGAGQLLARLDPTGIDAASAAANAEAVRAAADLDRVRKLAKEGWITQPRVESAEATAAAARARVDQTGFDVRFARINAPTAGVVLRRPMEPGQMVTAGQPVLILGEFASGYVLRVPLTDGQLAGVRLGQPAAISLPALGNAPMVAVISEIGARSDDRTGTFQVELRLPAQAGLRSGLIGTAAIRTAAPRITTAAGIVIPATAVFAARADEGFVYIYAPATGTVTARMIGLGTVDDKGVAVTHGLAAGEKIVRSGVDRLTNGMKVRVAA